MYMCRKYSKTGINGKYHNLVNKSICLSPEWLCGPSVTCKCFVQNRKDLMYLEVTISSSLSFLEIDPSSIYLATTVDKEHILPTGSYFEVSMPSGAESAPPQPELPVMELYITEHHNSEAVPEHFDVQKEVK